MINTTIIYECADCDQGLRYWKEDRSTECGECCGTGQIEYEETYNCIEDVMIDYPDAVEIFFYNEKEEDERKEK